MASVEPDNCFYELPQLIETHRALERRAIRRAVREWARRKLKVAIAHPFSSNLI